MPIYQLRHRKPIIDPSVWIAPTAVIIGEVVLYKDSSVWFGAVLRGDNEGIHIGIGTNIQENAVLHTDKGYPLSVGNNVTVGHQAMLHGCTIGDGTLIGIQAIILNGAVIGKNCLVAAGAVVKENAHFPDGSLIVGAPAQLKRIMCAEQQAHLLVNSQSYVHHARDYATDLKLVL